MNQLRDPFLPGALVVTTLSSPREKFWGVLLSVTPAGVSVRAVDINSCDDVARQLRAGEPVNATDLFFPMHRVERLEVDSRSGELPSIGDRFREISGVEPAMLFGCPVSEPA
jgi:hypothetical protein